MDATKAGWKSTEFWMNLLVVVVVYLSSTDIAADSTSLVARTLVIIGAVLAALGYTASRAVVKREQIRATK